MAVLSLLLLQNCLVMGFDPQGNLTQLMTMLTKFKDLELPGKLIRV